jgi:outer membrane protein assembly factor BamB
MWLFEGPTLDSMGNLYFSPASAEEVLLVSLAPDGSRRWVVEGLSNGCGGVITLEDPDHPGEQIIYAGSYDRAVAVRTDADSNGNALIDTGEAVWDVPTGLDTLTYDSDFRGTHIFGVNYDPTADAIVGLAGDGNVYALDRETGASLLAENFIVPGAPSPANPPKVPEWLRDSIIEVVRPFFREEMASEDPDVLWNILSGTNTKVANYFSVEPVTGRIWIAATAPDGEDGTVDGISEFGALYCYKLVPDGSGTYRFNKLFHISFEGGSASTPALNADGSRVYVGDSLGKLLCIDASNGETIWELDVGRQINASVSVASDNGELYLSTRWGTIKVLDRGDFGEEIWRATLDMYPESSMMRNQDLLTASITANGIVIAAGTSITLEGLPPLPVSLGIGLLDRETGHLRYFTENREESVSVSSVAPDGSIYIGFSPTNRMVTRALLGGLVPEIIGGVQKISVIRHDLLMRDAVYAAADRAGNVANNGSGFSAELKEVEKRQIQVLIDQCRGASQKAIAEGVLSTANWNIISEKLDQAESFLGALDFGSASARLNEAGDLLSGN